MIKNFRRALFYEKKALTTISALAITGSILVASPNSAHASAQTLMTLLT